MELTTDYSTDNSISTVVGTSTDRSTSATLPDVKTEDKPLNEKVPKEKVPKEKGPKEKVPKEKVPKEKVLKEKLHKEKVPEEKVIKTEPRDIVLDSSSKAIMTNIPNESDKIVKNLRDNISKLAADLKVVNTELNKSRRHFSDYAHAMQRQMKVVHIREANINEKMMALHLENEKLKTMLISKTQTIQKFQREVADLRKVVRYVVKSGMIPAQFGTNYHLDSDEYSECADNLKKDLKVQFAPLSNPTRGYYI